MQQMCNTQKHEVLTSHGLVAVETRGEGYPVLFIHGNSGCRQYFRKQMGSPLFAGCRLIAFDLPGHGESADATDPQRTYTRSGLADLTMELLHLLGVDNAAIVGHSLGGEVAIELLGKSTIPAGIFLMGTAASGANRADAFRRNPVNALASRPDLTETEAQQLAVTLFGDDFEPFMLSAILRTDPLFRRTLFAAARNGRRPSQRDILISTRIPTAIVNGENDDLVDRKYIEGIPYGNLWHDKCFRIPFTCHFVFWQSSSIVNTILAEFLRELELARRYGFSHGC
tara:strand:- start:315 stop:1166 length:852 start_codon:yes stop_codon:yes gene_type:complete